MMRSPAISVIVPVYNVENYLRRCVQSIAAQSFADWELVLVDDGSTDSSGKICDELALADSRIRVIHRPNGGLSAARNSGMEIMRGRYVTFVDSDDAVAPTCFQTLMDLCGGDDSVIACVGFRKVWDVDAPLPDSIGNAKENGCISLSGKEAVKAALYQYTLDNSAWGKLYPAVLWRDVRYREGIGYEDLDSFYLLFSRAREVRVSPLRLYLYTIRPTSYLRRFSPRRADVLDVTDRIVTYMRRNAPELVDAARSRALSANFNILRLIESNRASVEYPHIVGRCWNNIRSLRRRCLFDSGVRLKNKAAILLSYLGLCTVKAIFRVLPPAE